MPANSIWELLGGLGKQQAAPEVGPAAPWWVTDKNAVMQGMNDPNMLAQILGAVLQMPPTEKLPGASVTQLQRMIEEHGIPAKLDRNGTLMAMGKKGWEVIQPTLDAVQSWLGK